MALSNAAPDRSRYLLAGDEMFNSLAIVVTSEVACRRSVPSGGELLSIVRSRSFVIVIEEESKDGGSFGGGIVASMVIGERGKIPEPRKPASMFEVVKARSLALI